MYAHFNFSYNNPMKNKQKRLDRHDTKSAKFGIFGIFESGIRSFRNSAQFFIVGLVAVLYFICVFCSLLPGVLLCYYGLSFASEFGIFGKSVVLASCLTVGALLYILTKITVVPLVNLPFLPFVKPFKGNWYSLETLPWFIHNSLVQLVRYSVLEFIIPTPLCLYYFRLMGMKVGKGVVINTSNIVDPCLITLEDHVTLGGSANLLAHYGQKGFLIVSRLHIKKEATIGLRATVFGDVVVEEKSLVPPHQVVLPKTVWKAEPKERKNEEAS